MSLLRILALVLVLVAMDARAQQPTYNLNAQAFRMAYQDALRLSRYEHPWGKGASLRVKLVAAGAIEEISPCPLAMCGPRAAYVAAPYPDSPKHDFIYVELGVLFLPFADAHGLMVHEAVHFLQRWNGRDWATCEAEAEATVVQNRFLAESGAAEVPAPPCSVEVSL